MKTISIAAIWTYIFILAISAADARSRRHHHDANGNNTVSLNGIIEPLRTKAAEIQEQCKSRIVSTHRPGARIRGSGRPSLHASGRAVDIAGNPACIYSHLQGWHGGYSTDYSRVSHVHISWNPGGSEWGARFAHYQGHKHRTRYAHNTRTFHARAF